ncbi:zinc finger protein 423-like [Limulus polyphemus]|uniref:Zinc finger protein 423-like n=1 Tax=Limulus polyphemus TaxID=6850 RepID=A0ABM1TFU1_LIMPO|nr:zinc finger protein 423-like [Limulus polyphemus]
MPFKCDFCQRHFKHKRSRDRHVRLHTGDKRYRCKHCKSAFSRSDHLKIHMRTHDHAKPFKCTECNRGYSTRAALTSHMQSHKETREPTSSPAFRCLLCSSSFSSANELQNHKNGDKNNFGVRSENEFPVSDLECGFAFESSNFSSLKAPQHHANLNHVPPSGNFKAFPPLFPMTFLKEYQQQNFNGNFICQYCPSKFSSLYELQKHSIIDHSISSLKILEEENISCYQCSMKFSNDAQLTKHFNAMHKSPISNRKSSEDNAVNVFKTFNPAPELLYDISVPLSSSAPSICNHCNAAFLDFEAFQLHLMSHINFATETYKCYQCNSEFSTEDQLGNHMTNHFLTTKITYDCQCCLKLFLKPDELQKHLLQIHALRLYRCSQCKKVFDSKVSIQVHFAMQHSHEIVSLKCTSCSAIFCSELDFQFHVKVAHLFRLQPQCCLLCNQCFPSEELLEQHMNTHKKQYPCSVCGDAFLVEYLLDKHMQICHSKNSVPSKKVASDHPPSSSSPGFNNKTNFTSLMTNRGQQRNFRCDICDETFLLKSKLSNHQLEIHHLKTAGSEKATINLFCTYCKKTFNSRSELETHMKIHAISAQTQTCNVCDKVFSSAVTMAEHKLIHSTEARGSVCATCKTNVHSEKEFIDHMQKHSGDSLPAPCIVCKQTLVSEEEFKLHVNFHHLNPVDLFDACCVCSRKHLVHNLIITAKHKNGHTYMCKECFHARSESLQCK